jgi:hypothetical protein
MEAPELPATAENIAGYFTRIKDPASTHLNFDNNSVIRSVHDKDVAYGAPGVNHNGIHFEHAGYANQTAEDWSDDYSKEMLFGMEWCSARVAGMYCMTYNIPVRPLSPDDIAAGGDRQRGITTHLNVTLSHIDPAGTHTDLGPNFDLNNYVTEVQHRISGDYTPEVVAMRIPDLVGKAQAPNGGMYMAGADGGVFCFRGAKFCGNLVGKQLNGPVVDIVVWDDDGYWLIGADGGIFAFGSAPVTGTYDPDGPTGLPDEYARGEGAIRFGELSSDRKRLVLMRDDLSLYDITVGRY